MIGQTMLNLRISLRELFYLCVLELIFSCIKAYAINVAISYMLGKPMDPSLSHWYDIIHFGPKPSLFCFWLLPQKILVGRFSMLIFS